MYHYHIVYRWVLSAAHCAKGSMFKFDIHYALLGEHDVTTESETSITKVKIYASIMLIESNFKSLENENNNANQT